MQMDSILKSHLSLLLLDVDTKSFDFMTKEQFYQSNRCLYFLNLIRNAIDQIEFLQENLSALVLLCNLKPNKLRKCALLFAKNIVKNGWKVLRRRRKSGHIGGIDADCDFLIFERYLRRLFSYTDAYAAEIGKEGSFPELDDAVLVDHKLFLCG